MIGFVFGDCSEVIICTNKIFKYLQRKWIVKMTEFAEMAKLSCLIGNFLWSFCHKWKKNEILISDYAD